MQNVLKLSRVICRSLFTGTYARIAESSRNAPQQSQLIAACCGFPKDLVGGPSTARDHTAYGDDACFFATHSRADVMGVADGVGGWRSYGIDPGRFSRNLMTSCRRMVESGEFAANSPANLIANGYRDIAQKGHSKRSKPIIGSSTACIVMLDKESGHLHTANLGDSGFLVLRDGRVVHRSFEQQHYFNTPYQLSLPPPSSPTGGSPGQFLSDSPDAADITSFVVHIGDVIVLATDGLFDNLSTQSIEKELESLQDYDEVSVQQVCNSLALQARRLAFDSNHMSPFAQKAQEYGLSAVGGKPDDITIIVAAVTALEPTLDENCDKS